PLGDAFPPASPAPRKGCFKLGDRVLPNCGSIGKCFRTRIRTAQLDWRRRTRSAVVRAIALRGGAVLRGLRPCARAIAVRARAGRSSAADLREDVAMQGAARQRFLDDYVKIRHAEGRGSTDAEYYLALPYRDITGRLQDQWTMRATSWRYLERRVLPA